MTSSSDLEKGIKAPLLASCKEAAQLVSLSFERRLTLREVFSMRIHLGMCKTCSYYKKQITALRNIFKRNQESLESEPTARECLDPQARQRIKDLLREKK